jgi:hypothetical protein
MLLFRYRNVTFVEQEPNVLSGSVHFFGLTFTLSLMLIFFSSESYMVST